MDDALLSPSLRTFGVMVERNPFDDDEDYEDDNESCIYCESKEGLTTRKYTLFGKPKKEIVCLQCLAEEAAQNEPDVTDAVSKRMGQHSIHTGTRTGKKFTGALSALNA
jgi:hypothetical protein